MDGLIWSKATLKIAYTYATDPNYIIFACDVFYFAFHRFPNSLFTSSSLPLRALPSFVIPRDEPVTSERWRHWTVEIRKRNGFSSLKLFFERFFSQDFAGSNELIPPILSHAVTLYYYISWFYLLFRHNCSRLQDDDLKEGHMKLCQWY